MIDFKSGRYKTPIRAKNVGRVNRVCSHDRTLPLFLAVFFVA